VAIGATRSVGFRGDIWVVNPKGGKIGGVQSLASLSELGETLPTDACDRLCASGVTPLGGLPDAMAAVCHAGRYGERRRALPAGGDSGA
jgi:hypothetical protein